MPSRIRVVYKPDDRPGSLWSGPAAYAYFGFKRNPESKLSLVRQLQGHLRSMGWTGPFHVYRERRKSKVKQSYLKTCLKAAGCDVKDWSRAGRKLKSAPRASGTAEFPSAYVIDENTAGQASIRSMRLEIGNAMLQAQPEPANPFTVPQNSPSQTAQTSTPQNSLSAYAIYLSNLSAIEQRATAQALAGQAAARWR